MTWNDPFPEGIPGVIDGLMTIHAEPGSLALRVLCRLGGEQGASASLVELIIDTKDVDELSRALATDFAGDSASWLPCRVGFSMDIANTAA
jgi:hypothetical protein